MSGLRSSFIIRPTATGTVRSSQSFTMPSRAKAAAKCSIPGFDGAFFSENRRMRNGTGSARLRHEHAVKSQPRSNRSEITDALPPDKLRSGWSRVVQRTPHMTTAFVATCFGGNVY
jgi:hypothetical protein